MIFKKKTFYSKKKQNQKIGKMLRMRHVICPSFTCTSCTQRALVLTNQSICSHRSTEHVHTHLTTNHSNMVPKPGASQIVDALIPLVMEEIIEAFRRIPHERIRQRIVEETVRADTSCAGAGIVADSEQLAFESNPVVRADPADAKKSLAATLASEVASKNRSRARDCRP